MADSFHARSGKDTDDKFLDAQLRDTAATIVGAMGVPDRMGGKNEMLQLRQVIGHARAR